MNKTLATLAVSAALVVAATTAFAGNFDNTSIVTTFSSGKLEFSLGADQADGFRSAEVTAFTTEGALWGFDTYTAVSLGYDRLSSVATTPSLALGVEAGGARDLSAEFTVYGDVAVDYVAATNDLGNGDVFLTPTVGASYNLTGAISAFGEVDYRWNLSGGTVGERGTVEVGLAGVVTEGLIVKGSVVQPFNTANDDAQVKLETVLAF